MEDIENKEVKSSKSRLVDRYSKKYPEKTWDGEGAVSDEELYGYAADDLEENEKELEVRRGMDSNINEAFKKDRRAARSFLRMAEGDDPSMAMLEEYGKDFLEALQSDEGKKKFQELTERWKEEEVANETAQKEWDANLDETVKTLSAFAEENGMSDEDAAKLCSTVLGWAEDAVKGKISKETLQAAMKAGKYDSDVAMAREEGEVNGRNAKIRETLKGEKRNPSGIPQSVGSKAEMEPENPTAKDREGTLSMFGGIPVKKRN